MAASARSAVLVGAIVAAVGGVVTLAATNTIPTADASFGAPRWIVALVGLLFVAGGLYAMTIPWTTTAQQTVIGTGIALCFFTTMAIFFTWATLAGATGRGTLRVNGVPISLPGGAERALSSVFAGAFALVFDTIAVIGWWAAIKYLVAAGRAR